MRRIFDVSQNRLVIEGNWVSRKSSKLIFMMVFIPPIFVCPLCKACNLYIHMCLPSHEMSSSFNLISLKQLLLRIYSNCSADSYLPLILCWLTVTFLCDSHALNSCSLFVICRLQLDFESIGCCQQWQTSSDFSKSHKNHNNNIKQNLKQTTKAPKQMSEATKTAKMWSVQYPDDVIVHILFIFGYK